MSDTFQYVWDHKSDCCIPTIPRSYPVLSTESLTCMTASTVAITSLAVQLRWYRAPVHTVHSKLVRDLGQARATSKANARGTCSLERGG